MNKMELTQSLMSKTKKPVSFADMQRIVNGLIEEIQNAVANGDTVQVSGLGSFSAKERAARVGHNPQTGESIQIPARKVPVFKAGTFFKNKVNG